MTPNFACDHPIAPRSRLNLPPVAWSAIGLTLAAALLVAFYVLVTGAVKTSNDKAAASHRSGQRAFACGAATAASRDLCMLTAAVPEQVGAQAGSQTLGSTGLQARAD